MRPQDTFCFTGKTVDWVFSQLQPERVGHPEKLNQSLGVDVLEWYHAIVNARQQKKCERVGHPPTFDIRIIHSGGLHRTLQFNIAFLLTSGSQCTARSAPCQYGARSCLRSIFPAGVFGISTRNSTALGVFTPPSFFLQCAITCSSVRDSPWRTTMRAFTASPQVSCGMPITAHSYTCGMAMMAASTSPENTLKPPEMIMSFLRSTM